MRSADTPSFFLPRLAAPLVLLGVFLSGPAQAFRCNSWVIDPGLRKAEVLNKCGAPATLDQRTEYRVQRLRETIWVRPEKGGPPVQQSVEVERQVPVVIEDWVYNFGPQQFMQALRFENGLLVETKDLGYGQ
ncbi:DUF2845 domain-containing protein [Paucibacter sp. APW11]|uniref:DUF2845 domain-containing protein n=1 Tax=Roseateles aquae TaxID=3077235 RepID=A0ABU3PDI8_9BURK|nr:DUF2845 domain-containing protein [Paucibacter sp. APW11]MDT8999956.1 DUF2845 domain-containing protein [Paucibacter sp. APW11]